MRSVPDMWPVRRRSRPMPVTSSRHTITAVDCGVTAPLGLRSSALHCGIKASGLDLVVLTSDTSATAAGIFTTNLVKAAPVLVSQEHLSRTGGRARAIVVNSGCANACTGDSGIRDAREMAAATAGAIGCALEEVLVASTGVIGVALKMRELTSGIKQAARSLARERGADAARAIM